MSAAASLSRGLAVPARAASTKNKTKIKSIWNQTALCRSEVPIAAGRGIFGKHGLDVELINFGGSADLLLQAIGSGHADAGTGRIWQSYCSND